MLPATQQGLPTVWGWANFPAVNRFLFGLLTTLLSAFPSFSASPEAPAKSAAEDPVEKAYREILEDDDKAQAEIDKWILDESRLRAKDAGIPISTLEQRIEQRRKKVDEAYRSFILKNPKHARARLAYGSFLGDQGFEAEAAKQWEKARELEPDNPAAWNNLANYHGHKGPQTKAFQYYEKAIELAPFESVYHHNFAVTVYLYRKDAREYFKTDEDGVFDKALELYRKAMDLDPNNFELATDYAQSYYGIRPPRLAAGLKAWQAASKLARDDFEREGVEIHIARFELNSGRFDAARKRLQAIKDERYKGLVDTVLKSLERKQAAARGISEDPVN